MKTSQKFLVGVFLVCGVLLFAVGLFWIGDRRLLVSGSLELNAEFRKLSGLASGATVRVAGIDAGEVLEIQVPPGPESGFRVRFRVAERFLPILRSDSVVTIQTEGIIGNQFLQVDAGSAAGREVASGDTLPNREPVEVADLLQQASNTFGQVRIIITEVQEGVDLATQGVTNVTEQAGKRFYIGWS
jgi:phospholipid/cholesterol/gamma-HCH transport system substrate-binding protein